MKFKKIIKAMLQPLNLIVLLTISLITIYWNSSNSAWFFLFGTMLYSLLVIKKLKTNKFSELFKTENIINEIKKLNAKCDRMAETLRHSTNTEKRYRIRNVLRQKNEIIEILFKDKDRFLKQKIAKQTLDLVIVYIELLENYYARVKDDIDLEKIQNRINKNENKLKNINNINEQQQIEDLIEMDKKLLDSFVDEQKEIEAINNKIVYIESSISLFKQQILSSIEGENITEDVQNVVNEAVALNNVIRKRKKQKI